VGGWFGFGVWGGKKPTTWTQYRRDQEKKSLIAIELEMAILSIQKGFRNKRARTGTIHLWQKKGEDSVTIVEVKKAQHHRGHNSIRQEGIAPYRGSEGNPTQNLKHKNRHPRTNVKPSGLTNREKSKHEKTSFSEKSCQWGGGVCFGQHYG